ncbi:MAG: sigma-54-dependent Fis family transcriptional regulator [Alphaproteobacteria bacterium]|nr:sigma-54-dependent Fis family transcriptional regulator [Alphaproteobacteria bacterium]
MALDVLVVEDEMDIRDLICLILKEEGFAPRGAANSHQVFNMISEKVPNAVVLDIWLQGSDLDGLGILELIKKRYPLMPVIIISGHGTIETAVSAIKMGAYDYIEKPFTHEKLMIVLKRACEAAKLKRENIDLKAKVIDRTEMVGQSHAVCKLRTEIERAAASSGRVLITGQVGTGKELAARLLHKKSKRSHSPFIVFSPTGMSSEKITQELFGDPEKSDLHGSFSKRMSVLEAANSGTLFIDEITDLPLVVQTRFLKFIQDQIYEKPFTNRKINLDIRIIVATIKDIESVIKLDKFREDLYHRLKVMHIKVPKLSDRKEDVQQIVEYFVKQLAKFSGLKEREFSEEALAALQAYNWPGNIRQLRNVIEWTLIMNPSSNSSNSPIKADMLPAEVTNNCIGLIHKPESNFDMMSMPLREAREVFERQYLTAQMSRFNNNISKTSTFVGMERSALHRKLKLLNIHSGVVRIDDETEHHEDSEELIA